ncbi:carbon-phosphorus lyase complex subunit PhnI [Nocardia sp. NPDC004711]
MAHPSPGLVAVEAAAALVARRHHSDPSRPLELDQITGRLRIVVDQIMSEGGLWDEDTAARAFRQAEGDSGEAAALVRSFRLSLPRLSTTAPVDADELVPLRRVVPAYRTPPGRQILGRTRDYMPRLLQRDHPESTSAAAGLAEQSDDLTPPGETGPIDHSEVAAENTARPGRLYELLKAHDMVVPRAAPGDPDPIDITRRPQTLDQDRSARLALLARGETAALVLHWYTDLLDSGSYEHGVLTGELRTGYLPVRVTNPLTGGDVQLGDVRVTEAEAVEDLDRADEDISRFDVGYGLSFGQNERKAMSMACLDIIVERDRGRTGLEQRILRTADGMDANGLIEHLKLPHYVTFRAKADIKAALRARTTKPAPGAAQ